MLEPCPIYSGKYSTFQLHMHSIALYSIELYIICVMTFSEN